MKTTLSLQAKVTVVFTFLFILLVFAMLPFHKMQEIKAHESLVRYYETFTQHMQQERLQEEEVIEYLQNFHFSLVQNPKEIFEQIEKPLIRKDGFETFSIQENYYFHILAPNFRLLFKDTSNKFERSYMDIFLFVLIAFLFGFIYYLIIKNIKDTQHQLQSRQLFLRTIMHELKTPIAKGRIVSELIDDVKQKKENDYSF
jgi:two-component system OmpR family sensor kinase